MRWNSRLLLVAAYGFLSLLLIPLTASQARSSRSKYLVLVGTLDGNVHAIDEDLRKVWSASLGGPMLRSSSSQSETARYRHVIPSLDGSVLFQDAKGMRKAPLKSRTLVDSSPRLGRDGLIHVGKKNCRLFCVDLRDGSLLVDEHADASARSLSLDGPQPRSPFWLGRVDYSLDGVQRASGRTDYSVSLSELEPVSEEAATEGQRVALYDKRMLPKEQSSEPFFAAGTVWSSVDGRLRLLGADGQSLHDDPLFVGSPVMHAFLVSIEEDHSSRLLQRLSVRHGLRELPTRNRITARRDLQRAEESEEGLVLVQSLHTHAESGKEKEILFGMHLDAEESLSLETEQALLAPGADSEALPTTITDINTNVDEEGERYAHKSTDASRFPSSATLFGPKSIAKKFHKTTLGGRVASEVRSIDGDLFAAADTLASTPVDKQDSRQSRRAQISSIKGFHKLLEKQEELWAETILKGNREKARSQHTVISALSERDSRSNSRVNWLWFTAFCVFVSGAIYLFFRQSISYLALRFQSSGGAKPQEDLAFPLRVGALEVLDKVIGRGSHGTLVFEGRLNGRPVAVKRMLSQFSRVADREISLLIKSDGHPNVVRYFVKEEHKDFIYLGLQLCDCNLRDIVMQLKETSQENEPEHGYSLISDNVRITLLQIAQGLEYLHRQKIVHRDLKPHNILCTRRERSRDKVKLTHRSDLGHYVCKISDMGVSKLLDAEESFSTSLPQELLSMKSVSPHLGPQKLVQEPVGTIGWQAPEMVISRTSPSSQPLSEKSCSRKTLAVDVFSLGCIFFYALSMGLHPFGEWFEREKRIVEGEASLKALEHFSDAHDLIARMLNNDAALRPTSSEVCEHFFFWTATQRLDFVSRLSDSLERDDALQCAVSLEGFAAEVFNVRWDLQIDKRLLEESGKFRKYDICSLQDLLRLIRNKKNHFSELNHDLQPIFDFSLAGLWNYFEMRFPRLLLVSVRVQSIDSEIEPCETIKEIESPSRNGNSKAREASPAAPGVIVWQRSSVHEHFRCRGWWREESDWTLCLNYSISSKSVKRQRPVHLQRAIDDVKFRTSLCAHWEKSMGESCAMKKGRCVFAHGPIELRPREALRGLSPTGESFKDVLGAAKAPFIAPPPSFSVKF